VKILTVITRSVSNVITSQFKRVVGLQQGKISRDGLSYEILLNCRIIYICVPTTRSRGHVVPDPRSPWPRLLVPRSGALVHGTE